MGPFVVRNLDEDIVTALKAWAAAHGRSAEAEQREILRHALSEPLPGSDGWLSRARALQARLRAPSEDMTDLLRADRQRDETSGD